MTMVASTPTYDEMLLKIRPRPIADEGEADRIRAHMNALLDEEDLSPDQWDILGLLGDVLSAWERDRYQPDVIPVSDRIRALLEAHNQTQRSLVGPVFSTETVVSDVLHGRRRLNYDHLQRLAAFFQVSPALFFPGME